MIILICGDRNWTDELTMDKFFKSLPKGTSIIEGGTRGADRMAAKLAIKYGFPYQEFKANWKRYGLAAGPIRNRQMLEIGKPDLVIAFHNELNKSKGTKNMVEQARKAKIPVQVIGSDN